MSKLLVYRASAGSGKTYRLAAEYIKQVVSNPESYKNILAVTFTNKATAEMKGRIMDELFAISRGENTSMFQTISQELELPPEAIRIRAQSALSLILHDYSRFSVSTIDSFVQRVIQALLWEVGIQGGIDIELDPNPVLEHAADNLLDSASQFDELLKWLTTMGYSLLDEGKSWDVRRTLMELGKQIFSEKFRLMSREEVARFSDKKTVYQLKESLEELTKSISNEIKEVASSALQQLENRGIDEDQFIYGKGGVIGFFYKCIEIEQSHNELPDISKARVQKVLADSSGEEWVTKAVYNNKSTFMPIQGVVSQILHPKLQQINELITAKNSYFVSARLILKNLENLALIGDLWNKVRELSQEEGFLLLSDSSHLLKEFVGEVDAPFVYEKIGTRYDCFMIDEFQDTSVVQWHNFKPLIDNSLSQDNFSMIVGDVKQSIYRWRNGDWTILASGVQNDFKHHGVQIEKLETNRRSLPDLVGFNNTFFEVAKDIAAENLGNKSSQFNNDRLTHFFQDQLKEAYADVNQKAAVSNSNEKGYVEVRFYNTDSNDTYLDQLSNDLPTLISSLRENHALGDIAILVRSKLDGERVANTLLEYNRNQSDVSKHIAFVSQEGLLLKSASAVKLVIAAFRLVNDPKNEISRIELAKELASKSKVDDIQWHSHFESKEIAHEINWLATLNTRPLLEVFESVVSRYQLFAQKGELAYLAELHDYIISNSNKGRGDVNRFIDWWDQQANNLSLSVPDSSDAVSILTIHKSKGLQFPVVITPFANWDFRISSMQPLLWVSSDIEPFNILPRYPINATKNASQSIFAIDILDETMKEIVDNLNLLYVAFTRPEKELYIFCPVSKSIREGKAEIKSVSGLLWNVIPKVNALVELSTQNNDELMDIFCYGKPYCSPKADGSKTKLPNGWVMDNYPVGVANRQIRLSLESKEFFLSVPTDRLPAIEHGKVMHMLFSKIITANDIDNAVKSMINDGLIAREQTENIISKIKSIIKKQPVCEWFDGTWDVKTEASVLTPKGYLYRPDRVMVKGGEAIIVDYKFGAKSASHNKQMEVYINLLKEMGYSNIKGYLWYVDSNSVEQMM